MTAWAIIGTGALGTVPNAVAEQDQDVAYQLTVSLAWQSVWSNWADDVIPFDLSWRNLLYGPGPKSIAFVLNATINWAQTPDLLLLWGKSKVSKCALCGAPCSLHHILVNVVWRSMATIARLCYTIQPALEHITPPLLQRARDWRLLVDFEHAQIVFPP